MSGRTARDSAENSDDVGSTVRDAVGDAVSAVDRDTLTKVGRVGVAGLGVVYLLLAWLALQLAMGGTNQSADNTGALKELSGNAVGTGLLAVLAVAFLAYAAWQAVEAAIGFRRRTDPRKRTLKRVAAGGKALLGLALSYTSLRLVLGRSQEDSSDQQADLTARLLQVPGGRILVMAIGLAVVAVSGYLVYRGLTRSFLEKIEGPVSQNVEWLGVAGYVARGVVFGLLGILVVVAGLQADPDEARGLDAALKTLAGQPFGTVLLVLTALGLAAYGVYELVTARRTLEG